jgi:hypothetical protein
MLQNLCGCNSVCQVLPPNSFFELGEVVVFAHDGVVNHPRLTEIKIPLSQLGEGFENWFVVWWGRVMAIGGAALVTYYYASGSPYTWNKPLGAKLVIVECIGGGGGGGSGCKGTSGTGYHNLGGSGGGGGARVVQFFHAMDLPSGLLVNVGAAGLGGVWVSTTNGVNGANGGNSTFGNFVFAGGGGGGLGGKTGTNIMYGATGGSGGGSMGQGLLGSFSASINGGAPTAMRFSATSILCMGAMGAFALLNNDDAGDGASNWWGSPGMYSENGGA